VPEAVQQRARMYVEGFNAAHAEEISLNALVRAGEAEEKNGHRQFRIHGGYSYVPRVLLDRCDPQHLRISLNSVVQQVEWERGRVVVFATPPKQNQLGWATQSFGAPTAVITLPLGVLKASSHTSQNLACVGHPMVEFRPSLEEKLAALDKLAVGHVVRVVLRFKEKFWEETAAKDLNFLFTDDDRFPTWWTSSPEHAAMLVGWAPAGSAEKLARLAQSQLIASAVQSLAAIFGKQTAELEALLDGGDVHDWSADPYARGAYSYPRAGGEHGSEELARPVEDTLFFAGEATDTEGNFGTVHGAIASGNRAAEEVLRAL
jgi:monoamine oxidase